MLKNHWRIKQAKIFYTFTRSYFVYNTLVLPHFNYCITAWGYQCDIINKLQKKQLGIYQ